MDLTLLAQYFVLVVLVACLVVGYVVKKSLNFIPNKYIPLIVTVLGAVLNPFVSGFSIEAVVYGALTGLASTGLHQAFTHFIENKTEG